MGSLANRRRRVSRLGEDNRACNAHAVDVRRREAIGIVRSRVWISIRGQYCSPIPSERPAADARRHHRSAGASRPRSVQTPKARAVGPRFSEFPGRPSGVEVPVCYWEGGKARILGILSNPNLIAQVSKLGQNRERLHSGWTNKEIVINKAISKTKMSAADGSGVKSHTRKTFSGASTAPQRGPDIDTR